MVGGGGDAEENASLYALQVKQTAWYSSNT
jgi:hypothetical protein